MLATASTAANSKRMKVAFPLPILDCAPQQRAHHVALYVSSRLFAAPSKP
jgi:hypothetical protein